jgi:hypothetical protein
LDETAVCCLQNKKSLVEKEKAISHAANILGRTFEEVLDIYDAFGSVSTPDRFLHVIYWETQPLKKLSKTIKEP